MSRRGKAVMGDELLNILVGLQEGGWLLSRDTGGDPRAEAIQHVVLSFTMNDHEQVHIAIGQLQKTCTVGGADVTIIVAATGPCSRSRSSRSEGRDGQV